MNKTGESGADTKWKLQLIFVYYSSFGDRNNFRHLKQQSYRRFLIDSETVRNQANFPSFDIAFHKVSTSSVGYEQFLQLLPQLASLLFRGETRPAAFARYFKQHIIPLYQQIENHSEFGNDLRLLRTVQVEQEPMQALQHNVPLSKAFDKYILSTSMHQKDEADTFDRICVFLKDFEVSPQLIYKSICYVVFLHVIRSKEDKHRFQIDDLKYLLIYVAELLGRREFGDSLCQLSKLIRVLQHMELSAGFLKMVQKTQTESSQLISFFKSISLPNRQEECTVQLSNSIDRVWPASTRHKQCSTQFNSNGKVSRKLDYEQVNSILREGAVDLRSIKLLFEELCSQGQVANDKTLKGFKIKNLFQKVSLLKELSQVWIDITITDLCRKSPTGKIEFPQFVQLLRLSAERLQITQQNLHSVLLTASPVKASGHMHQIRNDVVSEMVGYVEKPLQRIFHFYSKSKRDMAFPLLMRFMYDFELFPSVVSKIRLYQIFLESAEPTTGNALSSLVGEKKITLKGLQNILIRVSEEIFSEELSPEQKIIILLEKMHESQGHRKVLLGQGLSLVSELRCRFTSIYKSHFGPKQHKPAETFQELLTMYEGE